MEFVALQAGGANALGGIFRWHCEIVGRLSFFCHLGAEDLNGLVDAWVFLAAFDGILEVGRCGGERDESAYGKDGVESHDCVGRVFRRDWVQGYVEFESQKVCVSKRHFGKVVPQNSAGNVWYVEGVENKGIVEFAVF